MSSRVQGETCSGFTVIGPGLSIASGGREGASSGGPHTSMCLALAKQERSSCHRLLTGLPAPCTQGEHNLGGQQSECIFLPI